MIQDSASETYPFPQRTGTSLWSVSLGKPVFSSPAMHADRLYVGCVDSALYCLSCATGDQVSSGTLWVLAEMLVSCDFVDFHEI